MHPAISLPDRRCRFMLWYALIILSRPRVASARWLRTSQSKFLPFLGVQLPRVDWDNYLEKVSPVPLQQYRSESRSQVWSDWDRIHNWNLEECSNLPVSEEGYILEDVEFWSGDPNPNPPNNLPLLYVEIHHGVGCNDPSPRRIYLEQPAPPEETAEKSRLENMKEEPMYSEVDNEYEKLMAGLREDALAKKRVQEIIRKPQPVQRDRPPTPHRWSRLRKNIRMDPTEQARTSKTPNPRPEGWEVDEFMEELDDLSSDDAFNVPSLKELYNPTRTKRVKAAKKKKGMTDLLISENLELEMDAARKAGETRGVYKEVQATSPLKEFWSGDVPFLNLPPKSDWAGLDTMKRKYEQGIVEGFNKLKAQKDGSVIEGQDDGLVHKGWQWMPPGVEEHTFAVEDAIPFGGLDPRKLEFLFHYMVRGGPQGYGDRKYDPAVDKEYKVVDFWPHEVYGYPTSIKFVTGSIIARQSLASQMMHNEVEVGPGSMLYVPKPDEGGTSYSLYRAGRSRMPKGL